MAAIGGFSSLCKVFFPHHSVMHTVICMLVAKILGMLVAKILGMHLA